MLRATITLAALSLISFTSPEKVNINAELTSYELVDGSTLSYSEKQAAFDNHVQQVYLDAGLKNSGLDINVFKKAYVGFQNLKNLGELSSDRNILTVVDFTKSSNDKRLWTIDLESGKVLINTFVAHGRNTGNVKALNFSNTHNSYMSSLGFYVTDKTYYGKHGLSLRLKGMDEGFNTNAMSRAIVMHGAEYATEDFIKQYGRLGRSLGCPAVPKELSKELIETIKEETLLYIHGNDAGYKSGFLDEKVAIEKYALTLQNDIQPASGEFI